MLSPFYGHNVPFFGGHEGVLSRQEGERLVKNDLMQLLLTSPGERVMRPNFGSPIRGFLFENMNPSALDYLVDKIKEVIANYENRVSVTNIKLLPSDENLLVIKIYGTIVIDRFNTGLVGVSGLAGSDLLVELKLPTGGMKS